jgi:hypothetical protein
MSDGLFLTCCRKPPPISGIQYNRLIVDNCSQLVMRPETFDLLVLPNLYLETSFGSDRRPVGGLGIVPSGANLEGRYRAVVEAAHLAFAPDIVGKVWQALPRYSQYPRPAAGAPGRTRRVPETQGDSLPSCERARKAPHRRQGL